MSEPVHPASGLSKAVWSDRDFDVMGWHDSTIYSLGVVEYDEDTLPPTRLLFDLDYIVRWLEPVRPARHFTFWVAPATLVFEKAWNLSGTVAGDDLEVADLHRPPSPDDVADPLWHLEGHQFDLRFRAPGYVQYFRRAPQHVDGQKLTLAQRGGLSLAETPFV